MSGMFGAQTPGPTRINQVQLNQSVLGYAVPVVMGRGKIQQSILWTDGFSWTKVAQGGGKGFGGGKGGTQYTYSADVIAGLCLGPVIGVGDVWSGQSWLRNTNASESYTIAGGTPTYTPTNAANMTADQGVGVVKTYSATLTDLGSSGSNTLSGSSLASFQRVAYGTALTAGTYSINPANNQYCFSTADVGKTVQLSYSFALSIIYKQDLELVPSGLTIQVGGTLPFAADGGVVYATGANEGKPVPHTVSGSAPATYTFTAADIAQEVQITYALDNSSALPAGTSTSVNFTLFEGYPGQSPWSLLSSNFPGAALGYSGIAVACYAPMDLGYGAQIQQNIFEVLTADGWGAGINDCSPVQCILQVLTNTMWGLGAGTVPFPLSAIDNGVGGTWGKPGAGQIIQDSTATAWFAANGFFISPVIDRQDTAASLISRWLEAGQVVTFMSEGLMKLVSYGDTSTAGNGAIWVAPSNFACILDDTCFLPKSEGQDPVKISSSPWQDAYNTVQVQWNNRNNQYAPEITPESDQAAINRYGNRIEDPQTWNFIANLTSATFAASMRVKRAVYTRNTYEFSLPYQYSYLEPMDVVEITTSSVWAAGLNNQNLAINNLPVRITRIIDNPNGTLDITCEDYPFGANQPILYPKVVAGGANPPNRYSDPGNSIAVIAEAPLDLMIYNGAELWIGAVGTNDAWGGCNVLASMDGVNYKQIGAVEAPGRLGTCAALPTGTDPDTTDSMVVTLVENCAALESATAADADAGNTLCYVDGELISYSACTVTGQNQYTANGYIRRGQKGTAIAAHSAGAKFLRLDDAIFRYAYGPSWIGKTIYLKFQSFNTFGQSTQDPSTLTAVTYTPLGTSYPAPPIVTLSQSATNGSGSGGSSSASDGVTVTASGGLTTTAKVWLTITWTWPANFPTPTGFNVVAFVGSDPTAATQYLFDIVTVGPTVRSCTIPVTPTTAMSTVNAAVEALYA